MNRFFKVLLLLVCMSLSFPGVDAKEVKIGKLKYKVNTTEKIAKCTGLAEEATKFYNLVIPSTVEYEGVTLKVTTVEKDAFWFDNYLKKVTLSDYTETIGSNAFASCDYLSIVSLGKKLKIIGKGAFSHCGNTGTFTAVELPATVEILREDAFLDCRSLVSVKLNDKLQTIERAAFWNCEGLKSITIPGNLTSIGEKCFASCDALEEVNFKAGTGNTVIGPLCFDNIKTLETVNFYGPGVAVIGDSAFIGCRIKSVIIPSSVHTIDEAAFCGNNLEMIELNEGLKVIGAFAFNDQYGEGLRSFNIPSTVTTIGKEAFFQCGDIETLFCKAVNPPVLGEDAFDNNAHRYTDLWVPEASLEKYMNAPGWKEFEYINNVATAVKEVETVPAYGTDVEEEWFDLSGKPVDSSCLIPGVYIRKHGDKIEKVIMD